MEKIVIIGNGISGITAARNIRKKRNVDIDIISSESDYFVSRTALMYVYMGQMTEEHIKPYEDYFWKKNRFNLINGLVTKVDTENKKVILTDGNTISYSKLIIATGSKPRKMGWKGQDLKGIAGFYSLQDLEYIETHTKGINYAVVVGGGLIGIEVAEMLLSRNIKVTMIVRNKSFWHSVLPIEESELLNKLIRKHDVDLKLSTEVKEFTSDNNGRIKSVITTNNEEINCQFAALTIGVEPNINLLKDSDIKTNKGVLINEYFETNVQDVYSIGDCAEHANPLPNRKSIEQVWYTGKLMGETLAENICGNRKQYSPGIWFNSAKFFDVEYQTYGYVLPKNRENEDSVLWQKDEKCIRIVYDKNTDAVKGINSLGIRINHEIFNKWIKNGESILKVVENLHLAGFDPEFYKNLFPEIKAKLKKDLQLVN